MTYIREKLSDDLGILSASPAGSSSLASAKMAGERPRGCDQSGVRVVPLVRYPYKVFYRATNQTIEILHIHHSARNTSLDR